MLIKKIQETHSKLGNFSGNQRAIVLILLFKIVFRALLMQCQFEEQSNLREKCSGQVEKFFLHLSTTPGNHVLTFDCFGIEWDTDDRGVVEWVHKLPELGSVHMQMWKSESQKTLSRMASTLSHFNLSRPHASLGA